MAVSDDKKGTKRLIHYMESRCIAVFHGKRALEFYRGKTYHHRELRLIGAID